MIIKRREGMKEAKNKVLATAILIISSNASAFNLFEEIQGFFTSGIKDIGGKVTEIVLQKEKNKVHEVYFDDGSVEFKVTMNAAGEFDGLWEKYNNKGVLIKSINYQNGKKQGKSVFYDNKGIMTQEIDYENNQMHGDSLQYTNVDGKTLLSRKDEYLNGELDGTSEYFNEKGVLESKMSFKDGKTEGTSVDFYEDGEVKAKMEYSEGKLHGAWNDYFKGGYVSHYVNYVQGEKAGEEVFLSITRIP